MSFGPSQSEHAISFNTSCHCYQSHSKVCDWCADCSLRSIVQLSRERIASRDLEPNLSQTLHSVWFISKLVIFIHKQLKRPVAFSVVQPRWSGQSMEIAMETEQFLTHFCFWWKLQVSGAEHETDLSSQTSCL